MNLVLMAYDVYSCKKCIYLFEEIIDGWMACDFYVLSDSISVISGGWDGDNERLCAIEPGLLFKTFPLP